MGRWILLLPLCLFVRDKSPLAETPAAAPSDDIALSKSADKISDPLAFLEECLKKYETTIRGYSLTFQKKERINGKYNPVEELEVHFREKPFSVYMNWLKGARWTGAKKVVYVAGQNEGKLLALPNVPFVPIQERHPHEPDAKEGSRFTIDQFGMHLGMQRTVASMKKAQARGTLHLKFVGETKDPRVGNVPAYVFVRGPFDPYEEDNLNKLTLFIDKATGLQIGSILEDKDGKLISEYFFRDIRINPDFPEWRFTREALKKK